VNTLKVYEIGTTVETGSPVPTILVMWGHGSDPVVWPMFEFWYTQSS